MEDLGKEPSVTQSDNYQLGTQRYQKHNREKSGRRSNTISHLFCTARATAASRNPLLGGQRTDVVVSYFGYPVEVIVPKVFGDPFNRTVLIRRERHDDRTIVARTWERV